MPPGEESALVASILLLSVSLSIDALCAGLAYSLAGTRIPAVSRLIISLISVLYAGVAIFAGGMAARFLPAFAGKLIGAVILAALGVGMIVRGLRGQDGAPVKHRTAAQDPTIFRLIIKSLGITVQILRNPDAGDIDRSGIIDIREALLLGTALSIDAVGAGIGSALSGLTGFYVPLSIGACQLLFLSLGMAAGRLLPFFPRQSRAAAILPGVFLIALSLLRLL